MPSAFGTTASLVLLHIRDGGLASVCGQHDLDQTNCSTFRLLPPRVFFLWLTVIQADDGNPASDCSEPVTHHYQFFATQTFKVTALPSATASHGFSTPLSAFTQWVTLSATTPGPVPIDPVSDSPQRVRFSQDRVAAAQLTFATAEEHCHTRFTWGVGGTSHGRSRHLALEQESESRKRGK